MPNTFDLVTLGEYLHVYKMTHIPRQCLLQHISKNHASVHQQGVIKCIYLFKCTEVQRGGVRVRRQDVEPCFDTYCLCDWSKLLIFLSLSFLICKVGIIVLIGSLRGL